MKRWSLLVLILFLLIFFDIPLLFADDPKVLIVEPFKISDYTQLCALPLDTSSSIYKENKSDLKPPEKVLLRANEFLIKGLKNKSKKQLIIVNNGKLDTPQTFILKSDISKMSFEIHPNQATEAWVEVRGYVMDSQSQKILMYFKAKRSSKGSRERDYYVEVFLDLFEEIGEDIAELLIKPISKNINIVNPPKHEPGKYTNWKGTCNEVEIFKPFNFINYSYINVKPLDTTSTIIPPKTNENDLHDPTLNYLSKIDKPFFEGIQENVEDEINILEVFFNKEDNQVKDLKRKILVIKGKVNKVDPGNPKAKDYEKVEIEGEVTDAQSNEVLLKFKHEQTSSRGKSNSFEDFIKGAFEETLDAAIHWNANDICELLKKFK